MARIEPSKPRFKVIDNSEGVRIVIPAPRKWYVAIALGVIALLFTAIGAIVAVQVLQGGHSGPPVFFEVLWMAGWFGGCLYMDYLWLWNLWGRELVVLRPGAFVVRRELFGLGRCREFDSTEVKALRVSPESYNPWSASTWRMMFGGPATIAFDYGAKTYRFGNGVEEAEARMIVDEIGRRSNIPIA